MKAKQGSSGAEESDTATDSQNGDDANGFLALEKDHGAMGQAMRQTAQMHALTPLLRKRLGDFIVAVEGGAVTQSARQFMNGLRRSLVFKTAGAPHAGAMTDAEFIRRARQMGCLEEYRRLSMSINGMHYNQDPSRPLLPIRKEDHIPPTAKRTKWGF